jgi:signal transduction histidine kinase
VTGSRKSLLAAIIVFSLVAVVVLGGMSWATVAQLELAEVQAQQRHQSKMNLALWRMEGHIIGVLASETARPYTDYVAFRTEEPVAAWSEDGERLEVKHAVVLSPITLYGPPYDWVELYFHVAEDGQWSSPQLFDELAAPQHQRSALEWLRRALPVSELGTAVARARERDCPPYCPTSESVGQTVQVVHRLVGGKDEVQRKLRDEYQRRSRSKIAAQLKLLPSPQCQEQIHIHDLAELDGSLFTCSQPVSVGVSPDPMATFWLEPKAGEGPKIAFVRTGHEDDRIVYQGFIADWYRLKPELLELISDLFPEADLEPVPQDLLPRDTGGELQLSSIPVRLVDPYVADPIATKARRSLIAMLATTWVAALAVLAIAAWGVGNLVALTNRRLRFAYAVTHELRTPLTTFRLYADMLSAGLVPEESKQEYVDTLNRESQRLSGLVEGVLEYARLENHRVRLNPVETDAQSLLTAVSETLDKRCEENGVEPRTENDLPDDQALRTDVGLVKQIAGVLLDNAARHARGSKQSAVLVHLGRENGRLQLDVIDTGPGVGRTDARMIFKPFRRGRGADAAAQRGIGLGLALARSWATLLGGRLDLVARQSPQYGGAHFRLSIPARVDA